MRGLAWSATNDEIWFAASENGAEICCAPSLWRASYAWFSPRPTLSSCRISPATDGFWVASADARFRVAGRAAGDPAERDLSWYDYTLLHDISADGKTILLEEQGAMGGVNYSVGVRALDGSAPIKLGGGYGGSLAHGNGRALLPCWPAAEDYNLSHCCRGTHLRAHPRN